MKIDFRSQTWVTHIWNAILGYRGFEVPCEEVSLFTKWPKKWGRKYLPNVSALSSDQWIVANVCSLPNFANLI